MALVSLRRPPCSQAARVLLRNLLELPFILGCGSPQPSSHVQAAEAFHPRQFFFLVFLGPLSGPEGVARAPRGGVPGEGAEVGLPGTTVFSLSEPRHGHLHRRLPALPAEHPRRGPLPAPAVDCGRGRRPGVLPHRVHMLHLREWPRLFLGLGQWQPDSRDLTMWTNVDSPRSTGLSLRLTGWILSLGGLLTSAGVITGSGLGAMTRLSNSLRESHLVAPAEIQVQPSNRGFSPDTVTMHRSPAL